MTKCFYCKKSSDVYRNPKGCMLKNLKRRRPEVTGTTLLCPNCYGRAKKIMDDKKRLYLSSQDVPSVDSLGSVNTSSSTSSFDSLDRLVQQRSLRSIQKAKKAAENRLRESIREPRALQMDPAPSSLNSDTSSSNIREEVPINRSAQEMRRANEMAQEVAIAVETIENVLPENQLSSSTSAADLFEPLEPGLIERFYDEDDDDDESPSVSNPANRLPGVQPYVKRRRTRVIFSDERLIPIYNNKSYGG